MATCKKWVNTITIVCTNWAERVDETCTKYADEGSEQCTQWEKCSWKPWTWHNCIAGFFCKAWYWVSKWVCKVFAYIVVITCRAFSWSLNKICTAWDKINCALQSILTILNSIVFDRGGKSQKIEHVFVLMLENRSYDHMLGFSNIRGQDSITGESKIANGIDSTFSNIYVKDEDPNIEIKVNASTPADFSLKDIDEDPGHSFGRTLTQLCGTDAQYPDVITGGYPEINNSGFVQTYYNMGSQDNPGRIMNCFSKRQLPVINKLAEEFVLCDNWFSSLPGPTTPNRLFLLAATSGGLLANPKPKNISIEDLISGALGGIIFENGHIFDELDSKCKKWLVFSGDDFPQCTFLDGMISEQIDIINGRIKDMDSFEDVVLNPNMKEKFIFIEPKYNGGAEWNPSVKDFTCGDSMHPLDDVTRGEKLIKRVYEAIRNSPHWTKSVLIITFDEHGGFYDHVKPPKAVPPGDIVAFDEDDYHFKFDQLGPRVPTLVISPLIKKGVIDSKIYDHTSILATLERLFGLNHLTERDKNANDLLHLFSLSEARNDTPTELPNAAESGFICEGEEENEENLLAFREELLMAQKQGYFRNKKLSDTTLTDSELGFSWLALLKVLPTLTYREKKHWVREFMSIKTSLEAAKYRTNSKLKIKYNKDLIVTSSKI